MGWVTGVVRSLSGLQVMLQSPTGSVRAGGMTELRLSLPFDQGSVIVADLDLEGATVLPATEYLRGVGRDGLDGSGQVCRLFQAAGLQVVVPDQLLVVGLVGATTLMRAALLSPQGPKALTTTLTEPHARTALTPHRNRKFQVDRQEAMTRMHWIGMYPSARRAWGSVYLNALYGRLELSLPRARVRCKVRGVLSRGTMFVTSLHVLFIEPTESPGECFAGSRQPKFVVNTTSSGLATEPCKVPEPMTDAQWDSVLGVIRLLQPSLVREVRAHSLRVRLDVFRRHLASGMSFYSLNIEPSLRESARVLFRRLHRRSYWPQLEQVLQTTLPSALTAKNHNFGSPDATKPCANESHYEQRMFA